MKLNLAGNELCQRNVFFRSLINSGGKFLGKLEVNCRLRDLSHAEINKGNENYYK